MSDDSSPDAGAADPSDDPGSGVTFRDRDRLVGTPARGVALDCLAAGIAAARPDRLISSAVSVRGGRLRIEGAETGSGGGDADGVGDYDLDTHDRVVLLGAGKASAEVAAALAGALERDGREIAEGAVVTESPETRPSTAGVEVLPGDHPVPSDAGVESARRVLDLAERAGLDDLVLAAITGGGSALLAAPADPISPGDLRELTSALLACGASIDEINAVRKHCSAVKGGRLARAAAPATVVTLAVSDVIGDPLDAIASGPTVALENSKRLLDQSFDSTLEQAIHNEAAMQVLSGGTDDHAEGVRAFTEQRDPDFSGE
jgi:hydroxypyruvate reductase